MSIEGGGHNPEGYQWSPEPRVRTVEHPQGPLESNDSGKIETRIDEEKKERKIRLTRMLVIIEILRKLELKELLSAVLAQLYVADSTRK